MPKWKELKRFCDRDDWELYKNTDHYYYHLTVYLEMHDSRHREESFQNRMKMYYSRLKELNL